MTLFALQDIKSGKVLGLDFDQRETEVRRKYEMLMKRKALPPLMLDYPQDFQLIKIGNLDEGTLEIKPIPHEFMFRLSDLVVDLEIVDGKEEKAN